MSGSSDDFGGLTAEFLRRGFSARVGFGERPALLVVDMIVGFTDQRSPLSCPLAQELEAIRRLLAQARRSGIPIVFSTVSYDAALEEAGVWSRKIPSVSTLVEGSEWVQLDPGLERRADEMLLIKKYASCFFGTDLITRLVAKRIDTLLVVGCTTSGCVRATVVDACSYGLHTIVVKEAVGDRATLPHDASLFDIDSKYGDVVSLQETLDYLTLTRGELL